MEGKGKERKKSGPETWSRGNERELNKRELNERELNGRELNERELNGMELNGRELNERELNGRGESGWRTGDLLHYTNTWKYFYLFLFLFFSFMLIFHTFSLFDLIWFVTSTISFLLPLHSLFPIICVTLITIPPPLLLDKIWWIFKKSYCLLVLT